MVYFPFLVEVVANFANIAICMLLSTHKLATYVYFYILQRTNGITGIKLVHFILLFHSTTVFRELDRQYQKTILQL